MEFKAGDAAEGAKAVFVEGRCCGEEGESAGGDLGGSADGEGVGEFGGR